MRKREMWMSKILIVEDDPALAGGLEVNLENCGYEIECVVTVLRRESWYRFMLYPILFNFDISFFLTFASITFMNTTCI